MDDVTLRQSFVMLNIWQPPPPSPTAWFWYAARTIAPREGSTAKTTLVPLPVVFFQLLPVPAAAGNRPPAPCHCHEGIRSCSGTGSVGKRALRNDNNYS